MEDLLREAGYKETRIFTPEAERFPADGDKRKEDADGLSVKESVGAVVGFLAGLVPGHSSHSKQTPSSTDPVGHDQQACQRRPHPPSPLANKVEQSSSTTSSLRSKKFTIAPSNRRPTSTDLETSSGSSGDPPQVLGNTNPNMDQQSLRSQLSATRLQPSQSAAYNYLRHMASTPSMQRRSCEEDSSIVDLTERVHPPLPIAWRENVIAAMNMKGSISTGGLTERNRALSRPKSTRTLGVKDSRQQNTHEQMDECRGRSITRGRSSLAPPQIHTPRLASPGAVAKINVMCKSAPGSRSTSVTRGTFTGGLLDISQLDKAFRDKGKAVRRPSRRIRSQVPSLIVTGVEGDDWLSSDGADVPFHLKQELDYDEDDEEEGELDLARMLVHPKRQQSIQSLRQHLQRHTSLSQLRRASGASAMGRWVLDEDTESDYFSHRQGDARDQSSWSRRSGKRRDRIPNDWEED
jgi:hypothetical protein